MFNHKLINLFLGGTVTKPNGTFSFAKINAGNYIIKVVFLVYEIKYIGCIVLKIREIKLKTQTPCVDKFKKISQKLS
jgi:hypothetical protein